MIQGTSLFFHPIFSPSYYLILYLIYIFYSLVDKLQLMSHLGVCFPIPMNGDDNKPSFLFPSLAPESKCKCSIPPASFTLQLISSNHSCIAVFTCSITPVYIFWNQIHKPHQCRVCSWILLPVYHCNIQKVEHIHFFCLITLLSLA